VKLRRGQLAFRLSIQGKCIIPDQEGSGQQSVLSFQKGLW
jgi:hypothetical protein